MAKEIFVPDIGDFKEVEVIELLVGVGDTIQADQSLISVESDKAAMEIPAPEAGVVKELKIKMGDRISKGSLILLLEPAASEESAVPVSQAPAPTVEAAPAAAAVPAPAKPAAPVAAAPVRQSPTAQIDETGFAKAYASPSVRKFARELGVDLGKVDGTGRKGRITHEDVQNFVKRVLSQPAAAGGLGVAPMPDIDFSQWGAVESKPLTKINKLTGQFLQAELLGPERLQGILLRRRRGHVDPRITGCAEFGGQPLV